MQSCDRGELLTEETSILGYGGSRLDVAVDNYTISLGQITEGWKARFKIYGKKQRLTNLEC